MQITLFTTFENFPLAKVGGNRSSSASVSVAVGRSGCNGKFLLDKATRVCNIIMKCPLMNIIMYNVYSLANKLLKFVCREVKHGNNSNSLISTQTWNTEEESVRKVALDIHRKRRGMGHQMDCLGVIVLNWCWLGKNWMRKVMGTVPHLKPKMKHLLMFLKLWQHLLFNHSHNHGKLTAEACVQLADFLYKL